MLNSEERSAGEHWKRAIRASSIFFNQTRLAILASFRDGYLSVRTRVAGITNLVWSFVKSLNIPSAKHIGFTIASIALLSLIAFGSIALSNAYNFSFVSQALFILFAAMVISALFLGVMVLLIAVELFRHQFLSEKRSTKKNTASSFRKLFAKFVANTIKVLSRAGDLAAKLASRIRSFGSYVLRTAPSSLLITFRSGSTLKKRNSGTKKVSKQISAHERTEAREGVSRDLLVEEYSTQHPPVQSNEHIETASCTGLSMNATDEKVSPYNNPISSKNSRRRWLSSLSLGSISIGQRQSLSTRREPGKVDVQPHSPPGTVPDKSYSALSISILSKSANAVSVAVIEILSFTRNSFSFLSVGVLSAVFVALALGSSSWQISDLGKGEYPPPKRGTEKACNQCDWSKTYVDRYIMRFLSFTAPRRNFDVGPGSYLSWSVGETDIKMSTHPTKAFCNSAVLIVAGMSSRSGSLHLNKDIAEERSFEAVRAAEAAIEPCDSAQIRPRIVRVELAERYLHAEDSSERVSLFLSSSVGDISYDRITAAIDAALEEDVGLTINPEESFIEVACPIESDRRQKASWLLSDVLISISDPWIRGCVIEKLSHVFSRDRSSASENDLAIAGIQFQNDSSHLRDQRR